MTLTIDGQASAPARIMVTRTNFGLFTQAGNGLGAANAQNQDVGQAPSANKLTNPALPGQYITLWGTGLGSATPDEVTIQLGGTEINFQIPDSGTLDGCYVSVIVKTGDIVSNEATIAKASQPGPCEHPFGLSAADMATLDSGGQILFGAVHLESDVGTPIGLPSVPTRLEMPSAEFVPRDAFDIGLFAQTLIADDSYFGCRFVSTPPSPIAVFIFGGGSYVDAGDALTLTGPGQSATLFRGFGLYQTLGDSPFLDPGRWRIEGHGGKTIGPFQADLVLPPVVRWTNRVNLATIDRGQDQDVKWDPTGYADTDVATVTLSRLVAQINCTVPAAAGKLTVPSSLLKTLPSAAASLRLSIAPRPNRRTLFSLPLTDGSAAQTFFDYSFSETILSQLSQ